MHVSQYASFQMQGDTKSFGENNFTLEWLFSFSFNSMLKTMQSKDGQHRKKQNIHLHNIILISHSRNLIVILHYWASLIAQLVKNLPAMQETPDRKSTRLNSSHTLASRMPSSA